MPQVGYASLAFFAGVLIPIMAALSGSLGRQLGNPIFGALTAVCVGFVAIVMFAVLSGAQFSQLHGMQQASAGQWLAGLGMAFYLVSITYLAPRFGVGNSVMFVVAAQIVTSAAIDHFGLLGAPRHPIDALRALGLFVMIVGVVIAQLAAQRAHTP